MINLESKPPSGALLRDTDAASARPSITVVLCHDAPELVDGLAKALRRAAGITVVGVATSAEEVERLVRISLPDVVLMGLGPPGVDGCAATRMVRAVSPTTRVALLTVGNNLSDIYKALRAGASGYVNKHNSVAEIAAAIRSVGNGHGVIPAHLATAILHDLEADRAITLGPAEREILASLARGESSWEVGQRLHLSEEAVHRRVEDVYSKLHRTDQLDALVRDSAGVTATEVPKKVADDGHEVGHIGPLS